METWTAVAIALGLCLALFLPFFIMNVRRGRRSATPGLRGGSRRATPISDLMSASAILDRMQTTRVELVTERLDDSAVALRCRRKRTSYRRGRALDTLAFLARACRPSQGASTASRSLPIQSTAFPSR